jgi:choline dehydrogenase-like flavoprotein
MPDTFDFVVVGGGSAGAVIASRLSEDPACRVALLEAGERPPEAEQIPVACASMQLNPATDWMYTADAGRAGLGLRGRRVPVPRGKMLGGSSGLNYMAYVRGHPGDFDSWAAGGASGWSHADILPYFRKSEGLTPTDEAPIDAAAHGTSGPLKISVRDPVLEGAREFVAAAEAAGIPRGDYNGRDRGGPAGSVSLLQTTTGNGKRSSTYRAFLEGEAEQRPNLRIITGAHATRVLLDAKKQATGVEYRAANGNLRTAGARQEVILSAGSVGSPHLLMLSGIGPQQELEDAGIRCLVDSPHVGKHLKDHVQVGLFFPSSSSAVSLNEIAAALAPEALQQWVVTGKGLIASSLYDASAWYSTGLGDLHSHDAQIAFIPCGYNEELWNMCLNVDMAQFFGDASRYLAPDTRSFIVLANPVLPHSEGEIAIVNADPAVHPAIRMNYFSDLLDLKVMVAVLRRAFDIAAHWPEPQHIGPWLAPPVLADKHGYRPGTPPSDAMLEDLALHFSMTVYHLTSTCRIGNVVDPRLRVESVANLRVADASIMPNVVSGNTNAASIMIGEKAAEMVAVDHGVALREFVGATSSLRASRGD